MSTKDAGLAATTSCNGVCRVCLRAQVLGSQRLLNCQRARMEFEVVAAIYWDGRQLHYPFRMHAGTWEKLSPYVL